jgi:hypothetical protein
MTRQQLTALPLATLKEMAANLTVTGDKRRKETFVNALIAAEIHEQEAVQSPEPIIIEQPAPELPETELPAPAPTTKTSNASIVAVAIITIIYAFCQLLSTTVKLTVIACFAAYNLAVKVKKSIPTAKSSESIDYFPELA